MVLPAGDLTTIFIFDISVGGAVAMGRKQLKQLALGDGLMASGMAVGTKPWTPVTTACFPDSSASEAVFTVTPVGSQVIMRCAAAA